MALNNIRQEPRRELIESALGYSVIVPVVAGWYYASLFVYNHPDKTWDAPTRVAWAFGMPPILIFALIFAVALSYAVLGLFPHWIGEQVSAALKRRGWDPRPEIRWQGGRPMAKIDGWEQYLDHDRKGVLYGIEPEVVLARLKAHQDPRTGEPVPPEPPPPPMTISQYDAFRMAQMQALSAFSGIGALAPGTVLGIK